MMWAHEIATCHEKRGFSFPNLHYDTIQFFKTCSKKLIRLCICWKSIKTFKNIAIIKIIVPKKVSSKQLWRAVALTILEQSDDKRNSGKTWAEDLCL